MGSPRQLVGPSKPASHRRLAAAGAGASPGPKAFTLDSLPYIAGKKIKPTSAPSRGTPPLAPKGDNHTGKPQERTSTRDGEKEGVNGVPPVPHDLSARDSPKASSSSSSKHPSRLLVGTTVTASKTGPKPLSALKSSPLDVVSLLGTGKKIKPTSAPSRGTPPLAPKGDNHTGKPQERTSTDKDATSGPLHPVKDQEEEEGNKSRGFNKGNAVHPSRMLSEKTASTVSQAAKNAIYGLSGPTKSPSTGLHKPTWKPTPGTPTGKPLEAASSGSSSTGKQAHRELSNAHPGDLTTSTAGKGAFAEVGPSKSPSTGIHKPTWKPTQGKPSGKPVEPWKEGVESSHKEDKNSAHTDGEIEKEHKLLRTLTEVGKKEDVKATQAAAEEKEAAAALAAAAEAAELTDAMMQVRYNAMSIQPPSFLVPFFSLFNPSF